MDKQQILQLASQNPEFPQAVQALQQEMLSNPITPEGLAELIKMLEFALNTPEAYPRVLQAAVADGYVDPEDMPEQYDETFLISLLAALYIIEQQLDAQGGEQAPMQPPAEQPMQLARGGLAQAAEHMRRQGRHGDTMLAHINPREAEMLRRAGGGGTINPETGLPEFFSLKKFLKAVAPIALTFLAPGIGTAIGSALGASGAAATMLGGAVLGGGSAALTGGNIAQGALLGGLGGGLGGSVGSAANNALGLGLSSTGQALLGSGLVGAASGALTGQGALKGALQGVAGQYIGQAVGGAGGEGLKSAGNTFGNMMTAGYDPKTSALAGGLSGLATGMLKPSEVALDSVRNGSGLRAGSSVDGLKAPAAYMSEPVSSGVDFKANYELANPQAAASDTGALRIPDGGGLKTPALSGLGSSAAQPAAQGFGLNANTAMKLLPLASMLSSQPPAVQTAVQSMSPAQQEYFNRPSQAFDWDRMQRDAASAGMDLNQYMAQNWNKIASGTYNQPVQRPGYAQGGALSTVARMARGAGSGRADTIDARLSDGEYVMDAETVAMLGDGSTDEGARRLDKMRSSLRAHKGKALARGKFSPNAKSPLAYLKESK